MSWALNWWRDGDGTGGSVTVILKKETEMEVKSKEIKVPIIATPKTILAEFETENKQKEIKFEAIWRKN